MVLMTSNERSIIMRKRLTTIAGMTAALAALALGGSAIATATQGTTGATGKAPVERTAGPDTGAAVQSGDQTTPDTATQSTSVGAAESATPESATESSSESSESAAPSDGPGGHEDPAGVDSQTQE
jgi:hypothetical protein